MQTVEVMEMFVTVCPAWPNSFLAFETREDGKVWGMTVFCASAWWNWRHGEFTVPARSTWHITESSPTAFSSLDAAVKHQSNPVIFVS